LQRVAFAAGHSIPAVGIFPELEEEQKLRENKKK